MSTTDLPGASLLADRYRLVERLGAGGMSVVWRGFDEVLGRLVAVKVLPPSTSTDPAFRRRLRAEAQAAARLSHPNITNVYDYGEAVTVDGEPVPYVVMELIDGESLAAVLARARRLPWQHAVRISAEVAAALAAAHSRGIVHRDVTPANVMLTQTGAKVVDFGISALIGENDIDPDGSLLGTPAYLAPERLEGGQVSPATDVYAVGLLIYRTLIGQLPWDVGTTTALLRAHQYVEPDPLPPVEGLPPAVAALIGRCLEKRPSDRPSSAELAHVLAGIAAGAPGVARGYVPDWAENGEDTTILPSQRSYSEVIQREQIPPASTPHAEEPPVRNSRFAALRSGPVVMSAAAAGASLRPAAGGIEPPNEPPAIVGGGNAGKGRNNAAQKHTRRVLVVAGTVLLLGLGTYGWSLASGTSHDGSSANPTPSVVPATGKCVVSYAVQTDANHTFTANLTVANRNNTTPFDAWKLWFILPGDQIMAGHGAKQPVEQVDHTVTVSSAAPLGALKTVTVPLAGNYSANNTAPLAFMLNGQTCETFVSSAPGEPAHQVEHLSDGTARLVPTPSSTNPLPGITLLPNNGVKVTPTTPASSAKPSVSVSVSVSPSVSTSPSTSSTPKPEPPKSASPSPSNSIESVESTEPSTPVATTTSAVPPASTDLCALDPADPSCG
ncbi:serine/threonine-protein kinase [Actinoplanes sp. NPDC026619]|uniref:serine/threonine-protein kinase n=1 Tax=Actinoplanes sp. NPDC026619 TaxID=3155798 RepID=UPI0033C4A7A0